VPRIPLGLAIKGAHFSSINLVTMRYSFYLKMPFLFFLPFITYSYPAYFISSLQTLHFFLIDAFYFSCNPFNFRIKLYYYYYSLAMTYRL